MAEFYIDPDNLKTADSDLDRCRYLLKVYKNDIDSVKFIIKKSLGISLKTRHNLSEISDRLSEEAEACVSLSTGLKHAVTVYERSEKHVCGYTVGGKKVTPWADIFPDGDKDRADSDKNRKESEEIDYYGWAKELLAIPSAFIDRDVPISMSFSNVIGSLYEAANILNNNFNEYGEGWYTDPYFYFECVGEGMLTAGEVAVFGMWTPLVDCVTNGILRGVTGDPNADWKDLVSDFGWEKYGDLVEWLIENESETVECAWNSGMAASQRSVEIVVENIKNLGNKN